VFEYSARILRCVDSDTVDALVDLGMNVHVKERLRFLGVNCPETFGVRKDSEEYKAGKEMLVWLIQQLCPGMPGDDAYHLAHNEAGDMREQAVGTVRIRTHKDKKGKYGRYLAEVFVGDDTESINAKLIKMGFGAEY